jgi:nucleoside-diphosphate kinase
LEKTFVIIKPDAVQRGLVGDIIQRMERAGLKVVAAKMIKPTTEVADKHYPKDRRDFIEGMGHKSLANYKDQGLDPQKEFGSSDPHEIGLIIQKWLVDFLVSGPVLAMVFEAPNAVELVRKIAGNTLPIKAEPGTIRGDYSFDSSTLANKEKRPLRNLIHASGSSEEADYEIGLWFTDEEIHAYDSVHQKHMTDYRSK